VRLETELERAAADELVGVEWSLPSLRQNRRSSSDCGSIVNASDSSAETWMIRRWGSWWVYPVADEPWKVYCVGVCFRGCRGVRV
jgi:hypothetical protein